MAAIRAIAQWLQLHLSAQAETRALLLNVLADASPTARQFLQDSLPYLSP